MSDVINDILERINIFHMRIYIYLIFGAKTVELLFISDYQAHGLLLQMLSVNFFDTFPNTVYIMLNIEPHIENMVLH